MKNTMKKITAILMLLTLTLSCLTFASAEEGKTYRFTVTETKLGGEGYTNDIAPRTVAIAPAYDAATGKLKWRAIVGGPITAAPAAADGLLYFTSQDGKIYCARIKHQAVIWRYDAKAQIETAPLVHNGKVVFGDISGNVTALNTQTGAKAWSYNTGGSVFSSAAALGDRIYIGSNSDSLYALDINTGSLAWQLPLEGDVTATPAVTGERVIVPTAAGSVCAVR